MFRRTIALPILSAALLIAATATALAEVIEVEIRNYAFNPSQVKVKRGDTVRWTNREKRQYHSVWFEVQGDPEPDYFFPEESYERVFDTPGQFPYHCGPHPEMQGVVTVVE